MAKPTMDPLAFLRKTIEEGDPDLLREMVRTFAETLMSAEASAAAGAAYGERSAERTTQRNGYRERRWDTRAGSIDLAIPKLRQGSYFPSWLLEQRRRAERALTAVVAQAYVEGVSTRRVDDLVRALGIEGISRSQVSEMAKSLDAGVRAFRDRPLDRGPYRHLWLDALAIRVREEGQVVSVATVVATAVNRDGLREILGLEVFDQRGRHRVDQLPAGSGRPRPFRRGAGDQRRARGAEGRDRRGPAGSGLAALQNAFHAKPAQPRAEIGAAAGGLLRTHDLRPAGRGEHPPPARLGRRRTPGALPEGRGAAGGITRGAPGLHRLRSGALAPDLVEQSAGAAQPRDPSPQ